MNLFDLRNAATILDAVSNNLKIRVVNPDDETQVLSGELRRVVGDDSDTAMVEFSDNLTTYEIPLHVLTKLYPDGAVSLG